MTDFGWPTNKTTGDVSICAHEITCSITILKRCDIWLHDPSKWPPHEISWNVPMQNQGLRVVLLYLILAGWEYLSTSALGLLLLCPILKKSWGRRGWDEKLIVIDWARKGTYTAIDRGFLVRLVYLQRMLWESNMRVIAWIWKRFVWLTYTATLFYDFVKCENMNCDVCRIRAARKLRNLHQSTIT